ncbi:MAG: ABC-type transporter, integral rane subunit [Clostridiales bacterium]|nr:ABC-type transporter, integral rane subunit [Clostridiales bacterium]
MRWWSKLSYTKKQAWAGRLFILPWFMGFVFIFLRSLITSFIYSFSKITVGEHGFETTFVGLENYNYELKVDPNYVKTLINTVLNMLYQVPLILIFSLIIACVLNQKFRGRVLARAIFFLPVIIATGQIISIMRGDVYSQQLMSGERSSTMFTVAGLQNLLLDSGLSLNMANSIIKLLNNIFDVAWKAGIQILLFIAGLQTIPRALYEVSEIEGATAWEAFWKITFPMLSPILILNLIYTIIDNFTDYSNAIIKLASDLGVKQMKFELSATVTCIYFVVIMVVLGIVGLMTRKRIFYVNE